MTGGHTSKLCTVKSFLAELALEQYAACFEAHAVDDAALLMLADADLREMGVSLVGHRKRMLGAIDELRRRRQPQGERRQVTVLFADLCGFTALAQAVDAEELHRVVARYGIASMRSSSSGGGAVDKHIGDAVMALFGAPIAHHDDPLRAARAAFSIHGAMEALGAELGQELRAHIGIASGEVVATAVRRSSACDYTVLGDAVNLASRLDALAGPCETLICEATHRSIERFVECDDCGEHAIKGMEGRQRVYTLRAPRRVLERAPFVGRRAELERLEALMSPDEKRRFGAAVLIVGEAGMGKSRLLDETVALAQRRHLETVRLSVLDVGAYSYHGAMATLLRRLLGLAATDARHGDAIAGAHRRGVVRAEACPLLEDLLDLPLDAEGQAMVDAMPSPLRAERRQRALCSLLADHFAQSPGLFVVEDVHAADRETAADVAALVGTARAAGALVVLTARPQRDRPCPIRGIEDLELCELGPLARIRRGGAGARFASRSIRGAHRAARALCRARRRTSPVSRATLAGCFASNRAATIEHQERGARADGSAATRGQARPSGGERAR